ncbi:hypothetical protein MMC13_007293 [Lambiella insularis]|nr:hypothetical protein [Lambiella insularis]
MAFKAFLGYIILTVLAGLLYNPIKLRAEVLGFLRPSSVEDIHGEGLRIIPNTVQCEDLHHHLPSGLLFTACQGQAEARYSWFPPSGGANFKDHKAADKSHGSIYVIDPKTFTSTRLTLEGFSGPFVTHGIDIYHSPSASNDLYIFAVNHLPNPDYYDVPTPSSTTPKARSQIEIFQHTIGTSTAHYLRTVRDPLIRTPNDLYATSATTFYLTNDHHYRSGPLRSIEEIAGQPLGAWSDIIHISLSSLSATDPSASLTATTAYSPLHNPNGLGHGANASDILIVRAGAGVLVHASVAASDPHGIKLQLLESTQLGSTLDNPSYYADPYASAPGAPDDASGYVLAGLAQAHSLAGDETTPGALDPVMVWLVQPNRGRNGGNEKWYKRLVFQDDGRKIRTASAAVLTGIDPRENGGRKQAWLWVTGFLSEGMVATRIDI